MKVDASPNFPVPAPARGLLYFIAAILGFGLMDATAKYLGQTYPVIQIVWARYVFHLVLALLFMSRARFAEIRASKRLPLQILRSLLLLAATGTYYTALRFMPLAEVTAIYFVAPMILTGLSAVMLKERVGLRRWSAVSVGFVGVVIIARPGGEVFHWGALLVMAAALCFTLYEITTRMLSGQDAPFTTLFYTALVGAPVLSAGIPFFWVAPSLFAWTMLVGLGALGFLTHLLLIKALDRAPASSLAPYGYVELIWAVLLGYVIFGDFPDQWTILGAAVVVGSGLYIFYRERRVEAPERPLSRPPE